jgi:hypothetical protein
MYQNHPNPFTQQTEIIIEASENIYITGAALIITDIIGRTIRNIPLQILPGENQFIIKNEGLAKGMYTYSLSVSDEIIATGKMSVY